MRLSETVSKNLSKERKAQWKEKEDERSARSKGSHIDKMSGGKVGEYLESTGGGTPIDKGETFEVAENSQEAEELREAGVKNVRVMQPRDEDGKFTYNSVNNRELKYGPSRGTTVPPFLKGINLTFYMKKKKGYVAEGKVYSFPEDMTVESFIKKCQQYIEGEGFGSLSGKAEIKKGRRSKVEHFLTEKGEKDGVYSTSQGEDMVKVTKGGIYEYISKFIGLPNSDDYINNLFSDDSKGIEGGVFIKKGVGRTNPNFTAKRDSKAFVNDNKDRIFKIKKAAEAAGIDTKGIASRIVNMFRNDEVHSFSEAKQKILKGE